MSFELIGRFFFSKMKPIFLFSLISLPLLLTGIYILEKRLDLASLQSQYEATLTKAYKSLQSQAEKEKFLSRYSAPEPYFLDHHIESFVLLQNEIDWLRSYENHPALAEASIAKQRLQDLSSGKNRIAFTEGEIKKCNLYEETEEKMKKPVEMSEQDVKKILCLIENLPISSYEPHPKSPQMIITNFYIKRKSSPFKEENFEVKLDLLKREFKKS